MAEFEIVARTIVRADDDASALIEGIKVLRNFDMELICDLSKIKLDVKRIGTSTTPA